MHDREDYRFATSRRRGRSRPQPAARHRAERCGLRRRHRLRRRGGAFSRRYRALRRRRARYRPAEDGRHQRARAMAARPGARCRCSSSPRATAGATRSRASTPAPTTTSPSPSTWRRCWRASARWCAAPPAMPRNEIECGPLRLDTKTARVTRRRPAGQAHLPRIPRCSPI